MTETFVVNETTGKATILKDPDAVLPYSWDWSLWLADAGDTISSIQIITDLTTSSAQHTTTTASVILSGGVEGTTYPVTCRITTAAGSIDDRTFYVKVKNR